MGWVNTPYGSVYVDTYEIEREYTRLGATYTGDGSEFVEMYDGHVYVNESKITSEAAKAARAEQERYDAQSEALLRQYGVGEKYYFDFNSKASCYMTKDGIMGLRLIHFPNDFSCKYRRDPVRYGPFDSKDEAYKYMIFDNEEMADHGFFCPFCFEQTPSMWKDKGNYAYADICKNLRKNILNGTDTLEYYERKNGKRYVLPAEEAAKESAARRAGKSSSSAPQTAVRQSAPATQKPAAPAQKTASTTQKPAAPAKKKPAETAKKYVVCDPKRFSKDVLLKTGYPSEYENFFIDNVVLFREKKEIYLGLNLRIPEAVEIPKEIPFAVELRLNGRAGNDLGSIYRMGKVVFRKEESADSYAEGGYKSAILSASYKLGLRERKKFDEYQVVLNVFGMKMNAAYMDFYIDSDGNEIAR